MIFCIVKGWFIMPYSEAQKRATLKYRKEKYSRISLDLKKEKKEQYKAQAASHGLSLNAYIIHLLEADCCASPPPACAIASDGSLEKQQNEAPTFAPPSA